MKSGKPPAPSRQTGVQDKHSFPSLQKLVHRMVFIKETSRIVWEAIGGLVQQRIFFKQRLHCNHNEIPIHAYQIIKNIGSRQNPPGGGGTRVLLPCRPAGAGGLVPPPRGCSSAPAK